MKKIFIISTLALIVILEFKAQTYVPFPTDSASWSIYREVQMTGDPKGTFTIKYTLCGADTTINSIQYKQLMSQDSKSGNAYFAGGIREENKKIYFYSVDRGEEHLLYNFNAQIGDTMTYTGSSYSTVTNIDSIQIDGIYRKRFTVNNFDNFDPDYIVEGIGSIKNGLLYPFRLIPTCNCYDYWEHICFKENGEVKYLNPDFSDCDSQHTIADGIYEIKQGTFISIKNNQIIIHSMNQNISSVKLITPEGKLLSSDNKLKTLFYNKSVNYNGLIICVVSLENGEHFSKKIIVTE